MPVLLAYLFNALAVFLAIAGVLIIAGWNPWPDPAAPTDEAVTDPVPAAEEVDA